MPSRFVTVAFLTILFGLPLGQVGWEIARGERVQALDVFGPVSESRLRTFEKDMRESSFVHQKITPWYQLFLTRALRRGNEKAIIGTDGWIHYAEDVTAITAPGYADEKGSAVEIITNFADQLRARDIALVVVPVPEKTSVEAEHLTSAVSSASNLDTELFFRRLRERGIEVIEVGDPSYMERDTHWTPAAMEQVARSVSIHVRRIGATLGPHPWLSTRTSLYASGDLIGMIRYPARRAPFGLMKLALTEVRSGRSGELFEPDETSPLLLLGDSFTRVFSDPELGCGEGAGFAEHIALNLDSSLDVIAIAGGSATAVRETLARRPDGLSGKSLVIWQISMRDLPKGAAKWKSVELPAQRVSGDNTRTLEVTAEITEVSRVPLDFEYAFCLAVYEYRVLETHAGESAGEPLWVAHIAEQDFEATEQAAFEVGAKHRLKLELVERHHDLEETSWIDDTDAGIDIWFPVDWEHAP